MRVEFFGVPRVRTGVAEAELQAESLGQLLASLAIQFPAFGQLLTSDPHSSTFVANINGDRFVTDPHTPLREDDCVLILSADAGG